MSREGSEAVKSKLHFFNFQNQATYVKRKQFGIEKKDKVTNFKIWQHMSREGSEAVKRKINF